MAMGSPIMIDTYVAQFLHVNLRKNHGRGRWKKDESQRGQGLNIKQLYREVMDL